MRLEFLVGEFVAGINPTEFLQRRTVSLTFVEESSDENVALLDGEEKEGETDPTVAGVAVRFQHSHSIEPENYQHGPQQESDENDRYDDRQIASVRVRHRRKTTV